MYADAPCVSCAKTDDDPDVSAPPADSEGAGLEAALRTIKDHVAITLASTSSEKERIVRSDEGDEEDQWVAS